MFLRVSLFTLLLTARLHAETVTFGTADNAFDIEFVRVGNAGNPPDDSVLIRDGFVLIGDVDYEYSIGKFEISREMVDKAKAEGLLDIKMESMDFVTGGARPEMPATGINWSEAAIFTNWLNTSLGFPPAYKLEGLGQAFQLWEVDDTGFDANNPYRNSGAKFVLPTADEWHKAAFYDPDANDGQGVYTDYATGSNTKPRAVPSGTSEHTAVYRQRDEVGPADITDAGGLSSYGAMAMAGNAFEWEETAFDLENDRVSEARGARGGSWIHKDVVSAIRAFDFIGSPGNLASQYLGFRVAMLPDAEPGDFDRDGSIAATDMDFLSGRVRSSTVEAIFDLDDNLAVNQQDREIWVANIVGTHFGDADLNGTVDFDDFALLSASFGQQGGWGDGDFDGSGTTDFEDFVILANNFGKDSIAGVPEPCSRLPWVCGLVAIVALRRASANVTGRLNEATERRLKTGH